MFTLYDNHFTFIFAIIDCFINESIITFCISEHFGVIYMCKSAVLPWLKGISNSSRIKYNFQLLDIFVCIKSLLICYFLARY